MQCGREVEWSAHVAEGALHFHALRSHKNCTSVTEAAVGGGNRKGIKSPVGEEFNHCTLGKSLNRNSREQSYIKWQFLKKLMMETEMF